MTTYPATPLTLLFLPPKLSIAPPPGFRLGERILAELPKRDPDSGAALNLLSSPFSRLMLGGARIHPVDVPEGALLLSGTQHLVQPGDGDVLVVMLARRKAGMTHAAWRDRWLNGHARFGLGTAASGYRQLHPDEPPSPEGFDGAGLVFFRDRGHAASARAAPEIARDATRDELAFIDHSRSMLMMFELH
jgi:hypothetical protein